MTKEELIGRKFNTDIHKDNSEGYYTIFKIEGNRVWINWKTYKEGTRYSVDAVLNYFKAGIWTLLPLESKMKYSVGDAWQYKDSTTKYVIIEIQDNIYRTKIFGDRVQTARYDINTVNFAMSNHKLEGKYSVTTGELETTMHKFKVGDKLVRKTSVNNYIADSTTITQVLDKVYKHITTDNGTYEMQDRFKWIEDNYELKTMKEVIEVGDTVEVIKNTPHRANYIGQIGVVCFTPTIPSHEYSIKIGTETSNTFFNLHELKLVAKANKQEIIGYELLKDLPGIPAGTKGEKAAFGYNFIASDGTGNTFNNKQLSDTTWFKPVYKAKKVVVKISNGREVIIDEVVTIKGIGALTKEDVKNIYDNTQSSTIRSSYTVTIEVVKIGCQEFTKEDIELVYKAIQNIK